MLKTLIQFLATGVFVAFPAAQLFAGVTTMAPTTPAAAPPTSGVESWWNGPTLTDDWFSQGDTMRKHGVYLQTDLTQYEQGLVSGTGNHDFEYGGKLDANLHIEGEQAGTWKGLSLDTHMEYLYGDNALHHGGTASPVNTALLLPQPGSDILTLSSLFITQKLGQFSLSVGRFNTIDFTAFSPYDGGAGTTFWNLSFVAPMVQAKTVAPVTNGALLKFDTKHSVDLTLAVFDPTDSSVTTGLPNLYNNGVTLLGSVDVTTKFFGLAGKQTVAGTWSNQQSNDIGQLRELLLPRLFGTPSAKDSTWSVNYHFEQALYQPKDDPTKGFGLFGTAGVSDGNPNPVKWNATFGLGGHSPIPTREDDRIGIGYYYLGLSGTVKNQPFLSGRLRDEQGTEMFYTAAINKWWNVTADLQVIDPMLTRGTTDVVFGMSTGIKF